jgi:hypothetical protein
MPGFFLAESVSDSTASAAKTPWHIWAVGIAAVLWNSVGATDFLMTETRNKAYLSGFTQAQLEFCFNIPAWAVATWGIATWGGVLGSLLILLRRRQAVYLFLASTLCTVLTDVYSFVLSDGFKVMGGAPALAFSAVILVIGVLLLVYARSMRGRGVLR